MSKNKNAAIMFSGGFNSTFILMDILDSNRYANIYTISIESPLLGETKIKREREARSAIFSYISEKYQNKTINKIAITADMISDSGIRGNIPTGQSLLWVSSAIMCIPDDTDIIFGYTKDDYVCSDNSVMSAIGNAIHYAAFLGGLKNVSTKFPLHAKPKSTLLLNLLQNHRTMFDSITTCQDFKYPQDKLYIKDCKCSCCNELFDSLIEVLNKTIKTNDMEIASYICKYLADRFPEKINIYITIGEIMSKSINADSPRVVESFDMDDYLECNEDEEILSDSIDNTKIINPEVSIDRTLMRYINSDHFSDKYAMAQFMLDHLKIIEKEIQVDTKDDVLNCTDYNKYKVLTNLIKYFDHCKTEYTTYEGSNEQRKLYAFYYKGSNPEYSRMILFNKDAYDSSEAYIKNLNITIPANIKYDLESLLNYYDDNTLRINCICDLYEYPYVYQTVISILYKYIQNKDTEKVLKILVYKDKDDVLYQFIVGEADNKHNYPPTVILKEHVYDYLRRIVGITSDQKEAEQPSIPDNDLDNVKCINGIIFNKDDNSITIEYGKNYKLKTVLKDYTSYYTLNHYFDNTDVEEIIEIENMESFKRLSSNNFNYLIKEMIDIVTEKSIIEGLGISIYSLRKNNPIFKFVLSNGNSKIVFNIDYKLYKTIKALKYTDHDLYDLDYDAISFLVNNKNYRSSVLEFENSIGSDQVFIKYLKDNNIRLIYNDNHDLITGVTNATDYDKDMITDLIRIIFKNNMFYDRRNKLYFVMDTEDGRILSIILERSFVDKVINKASSKEVVVEVINDQHEEDNKNPQYFNLTASEKQDDSYIGDLIFLGKNGEETVNSHFKRTTIKEGYMGMILTYYTEFDLYQFELELAQYLIKNNRLEYNDESWDAPMYSADWDIDGELFTFGIEVELYNCLKEGKLPDNKNSEQHAIVLPGVDSFIKSNVANVRRTKLLKVGLTEIKTPRYRKIYDDLKFVCKNHTDKFTDVKTKSYSYKVLQYTSEANNGITIDIKVNANLFKDIVDGTLQLD